MDGSYCQCMIGPVAGAFLRYKIVSSPMILGAIPVNILFVAIMLKNFSLKDKYVLKCISECQSIQQIARAFNDILIVTELLSTGAAFSPSHDTGLIHSFPSKLLR